VLSEPPPPQPDPFTSYWFDNGMPFLDRTQVRSGVQLLADNSGCSVLLVNGPRASGKSFTGEFIDFVARELETDQDPSVPRFEAAHLELEEGYGATYTPDVLAREIAEQMGSSRTPPTGTPGNPHWIEALVGFVLVEAKASESPWWWVFDGYKADDLNQDTRRFIHTLAKRVSRGAEARRGRVILIDYTHPITGVLPPKIKETTLGPPAGIGEVDVRDYYAAVSASLPNPLPPEGIEDLVKDALHELPEDERRLPELNARLQEVTGALRARVV
jgi:hypothetical protein